MRTRASLDAEWDSVLTHLANSHLGIEFSEAIALTNRARELVAAEREYVDRAAQARILRWAAAKAPSVGRNWVDDLADRVEAGDIEVPRE